jgi:tryptophan halogenase
MGKPIRKITIVGGGTAGWFSAVFLTTSFTDAIRSGKLEVTLIESPNLPIVGVGEASAPAMSRAFKQMGIDETKFVRHTNATFKLGGVFADWNRDAKGNPTAWVNPFNDAGMIHGLNPGYWYALFGKKSKGPHFADDYTEVMSPAPDLIRARKGPRPLGNKDFDGPVRYAYHTDALRLAEYLGELARERGVKHILDDVTDVKLDERGYVTSLELKARGRHDVELVLDCSGFHGLVARKAMQEPFVPYDNYMLNDRAAVVQIPYDAPPTSLEPATRATGLANGWRFLVPLYNRVGTGYVFSSKFVSEDQAVSELLESIGERGKGLTPRVIPMTIGKLRNSWVKNCVAIGLSSGFIEPLEATAIYMTEMALRWLFIYFPDKDYPEALRKRYNDKVNGLYNEITDYIALHFHLNNRTDSPYWIAAREEMPIPDTLRENLEIWKHSIPIAADLRTDDYFTHRNYNVALFGKGFYDKAEFPKILDPKRTDWERFIVGQRKLKKQLTDQLPDHVELLQWIRGEKDLPSQSQPKTAPTPGPAPLQAAGTVPLPGQAFAPTISWTKGR